MLLLMAVLGKMAVAPAVSIVAAAGTTLPGAVGQHIATAATRQGKSKTVA